MTPIDKEILQLVDDMFGQDEVYMWSTYVLPNGRFLNPDNYEDFEDEFGMMAYEHEDFHIEIDDMVDGEHKTYYAYSVLETYCVKMNVTYPYLALPKARVTPQQLNAIEKILKAGNENSGFDMAYEYEGLMILTYNSGERLYDWEELLDIKQIRKDIVRSYTQGFLESKTVIQENIQENIQELDKAHHKFSNQDKLFILQDIYDDIQKQIGYHENDDLKFSGHIIYTYHIISYDYDYNTTYNDTLDEWEETTKLVITSVDTYDYEELLKQHNTPYEKSRVSETIYLDGGTTRISTHRRPGYELYGSYTRHDYKKEYICKDEIEMYYIIRDLLRERS